MLAATGILAGVGSLAKLNLGQNLELWVLPLAVFGSLALGSLLTIRGSDHYYKAERNKLREQLRQLRIYTEDARNALNALRSKEIGLESFPADPTGRLKALLCTLPNQLIEAGTGFPTAMSVWLEGTDGQFDIPFSAKLPQEEVADFRVTVARSWLYHSAQPRTPQPDGSPLARINSLKDYSDGSPDLKVLSDLGYESVRAFAVDICGHTVRLVAVSRQPHAFGSLEDAYLLFLWSVLTIAAYQVADERLT